MIAFGNVPWLSPSAIPFRVHWPRKTGTLHDMPHDIKTTIIGVELYPDRRKGSESWTKKGT